jgi:NIMA (never in mitosis gene a)-related kinase
LLPAGDLHSILQKRKGLPLSEDVLMDWFVQLCLGIKHVHDRKILHR